MISKVVHFFNEITGFSDHPVFIGDLKLGTVVQDTELNEIGEREPSNQFGHIVGFGRGGAGEELVVRVQWACSPRGEYDYIHPNHLILVIGLVR
jgi:hypothetical protein